MHRSIALAVRIIHPRYQTTAVQQHIHGRGLVAPFWISCLVSLEFIRGQVLLRKYKQHTFLFQVPPAVFIIKEANLHSCNSRELYTIVVEVIHVHIVQPI